MPSLLTNFRRCHERCEGGRPFHLKNFRLLQLSVAMSTFLNWKSIAIALLITIRTVSAQDFEFPIKDNSLPSSPTQLRDFPLRNLPEPSSLESPNDAYNSHWGIGNLAQQAPSQPLDEPDSLLLANENNRCQISPDQSQNTWRRRQARMKRE